MSVIRPTRLTITLNPDEYRALAQLAEREDRPPLLQLRHLLRQELRRAGLLPDARQQAGEVRHGE
ncbi:MAG: hypothetical protein IRY86_10160 [Thermorudis peleae]|nr:hypothetical protein [Thermorudis peleae]